MVVELERMDRQRRNLTADIAHELRTPIQIIQGNLEGILDGVYAADEEHIQSTLDEVRLLARLVSDLRELSLAESGELKLNYEEFSLFDFMEDVYTSFSPKAEQNRLNLSFEKRNALAGNIPDDEVLLTADPDRLHQVLGNLVSNAIRFTDEGGEIVLICTALPENVLIQVRDTGKGITEEDLPFVFDRFWQGDHSRSHQDGSGTGLGLAISQKFVEAHGGVIDVRSEVGKGTLFRVKLPWHPEE
jgi:two-component system OmpR family sensor kinase/two-component system sensor histidine kinase BaeS